MTQDWKQYTGKQHLLTLHEENDREILRQVSQTVSEFGDDLKQFCQYMLEIMHKEQGIGLAAPQIGVLYRIFVMQIEEDGPEYVLINPTITPLSSKDEREVDEEGCLSVPGIYADVERDPVIRVDAQDPFGKAISFEAKGLLSICLQHENDHLDGILFIDYLKRSQKKKIMQYFEEEGSLDEFQGEDEDALRQEDIEATRDA